MKDINKIHVATISEPHGIKGDVKITSLTSPIDNLLSYDKLYDINGVEFSIKPRFIHKNKIIARINEIDSRNECEKLLNTKLYISREDFAQVAEDEFYYQDLLGCNVVGENNEIIGVVNQVDNFGSGDLIEVKFNNDTMAYFPFIKEIFPKVDLAQRILVFIEPENL